MIARRHQPPEARVIIRDYRAADFERLYQIDHAAFVPDLAYSRAELHYYLALRRARSLVAEVEGTVVAFVIARCMQRGWGTVITLDVLPGWQRQGIGSRLLAAIETWLAAEGVRVVALETPADESSARRFYEQHGYQVGGRVPGYYHGRLDAYGMVKRLDDSAQPAAAPGP